MRDLDEVLVALSRSPFRRRFKLGAREKAYLHDKGLPEILVHARDFVSKRLAPARPANDGKQTPMRNHPVFIAQHATATCCRGCLQKWHGIATGRSLSLAEQEHVVTAIEIWLAMQPGVSRQRE